MRALPENIDPFQRAKLLLLVAGPCSTVGQRTQGAIRCRPKESTVTALLSGDRLLGSHCHPSPAGCSDSEVSALVSSRAYVG